jgi:thiamine monophosphate synthase
MVFISNVFDTQSYPDKKKLSLFNFFSMCFLLKKKKVFALGGVNKSNFKKLKNRYLYGFGAISYFKN